MKARILFVYFFRMAEPLLPLTGDLKKISECSLYRDPRVSTRARFHTFCRECKETTNIGQDSCPLCRSFFGIPDEECGSVRRNFFMEKLVDLHQAYLERKLNLKGEQIVGEISYFVHLQHRARFHVHLF